MILVFELMDCASCIALIMKKIILAAKPGSNLLILSYYQSMENMIEYKAEFFFIRYRLFYSIQLAEGGKNVSLQFIIGSSGIGKTHYACEQIIRESMENPQHLYYIIVPEQFTMQTQKNVVEMHPGKGILNIDVLSFQRLAYRIFEETGGAMEVLLDDTGKSMVLQKLVQQHRKNLPYLGSQMNKPGYLDEVKSLISEFMQYDIREEELQDMLGKTGEDSLLHMKMQDVGVLYQAFLQYLEGHYMTGEGVMDALKKAIPFSDKLKKSVLLLDGFTGFTPVQMNVIRELLNVCDKVLVTVTMDARENPLQMGKPHQLFYMSRKMIHTLSGLTGNLDDSVLLKDERKGRFGNSTSLDFLEKHLFRYRRSVYEKKQEEICIFAAESPVKELEETARRIRRLVREKNLKYGEIAVITGNLEAYKSIASQVFEESRIPYFLDEKHTILMNPFIEYIRAALEMVTKGFSYESVFRYLRCDMSGLARNQVDMLENYVLALGIRGYKKWSEKWVRVYRTMDPEDIQVLNEYREIFVREAEILAQGFSSVKRKVCEYCYSLYQFIASCEIQKKLKKQELFFKEKGETYFHKIRHEGFLRHLVMRRSVKTGDILINLVTTTQSRLDESEFVNMILSQKIDGKVVGILHTLNDNLADVVQSDETKTLYGQDYFYEYLYNMRFKISPFSFFQTNTLGAEVLYDQVREYVGETKDKLVYDLYTGTGTIANFVSRRARQVIGIEYVPEAIEDAKVNAEINDIKNALFYAGDMKDILTQEFINEHGRPDVIITDPPRAGMHQDVVDVILFAEPKRIVYVSCNPATQARDLQLLDGKYKVKAVQPVDMFPHTHHVENVVLLELR